MVFLDFEKPIAELYQQLEKLELARKKHPDAHADAINAIREKIALKRKEIYSRLTRWQKVQVARHPERPYTLQYLRQICDEFVQLHGDRCFKDDKAIVGGLCKMNDIAFVAIGHQKGTNTKMRQYRNFGMPNPEGYRKALRLMKLAEKFSIPVVTFIDTPGAYPGIEAEERGQAEAIARNLFEMARLKTPILTFIIGEGASGGAIGIGVSDKTYMLEHTWYSVISPESCSSILWRNWENKEKAAEALKLTAQDNFKFGLIDGVLEEPIGGAHTDLNAMASVIKRTIIEELTALKKLTNEELLHDRICKYESMGSL